MSAMSIPEFDELPADSSLRAAFDDAGVVILRGFASHAACQGVRDRALELVASFDERSVRSVFSTRHNPQMSDDYFIRSGADIGFFFEQEAFDESGCLRRAKAHSINKMGHAMHDLDPVFDAFSRDPRLAAVARAIGFRDPLLVQSMYIFKPPEIGGEVVCHQDSTYLFTDPESCVGFWFAIDDADLENGCMQFAPGEHKGSLRELNSRDGDGVLGTQTVDDAPFPDDASLVAAPARQGDLVIFHGRAPHMSPANRSSRPRHAYTLHLVERAAHWPASNWLQRPAHLPFRGFD